jgi:hypothetical protein
MSLLHFYQSIALISPGRVPYSPVPSSIPWMEMSTPTHPGSPPLRSWQPAQSTLSAQIGCPVATACEICARATAHKVCDDGIRPKRRHYCNGLDDTELQLLEAMGSQNSKLVRAVSAEKQVAVARSPRIYSPGQEPTSPQLAASVPKTLSTFHESVPFLEPSAADSTSFQIKPRTSSLRNSEPLHPDKLPSPNDFWGPVLTRADTFKRAPSPSRSATPSSGPSLSSAGAAVGSNLGDGGGTRHQYRCTFPGCNSAPFQTQYLLNAHANVHSSARPHYCPVAGCPRGEGGRGFKRKNEMIRHGLVHDSPGYICPFCPDRDHKYPRPDNLQRYFI